MFLLYCFSQGFKKADTHRVFFAQTRGSGGTGTNNGATNAENVASTAETQRALGEPEEQNLLVRFNLAVDEKSDATYDQMLNALRLVEKGDHISDSEKIHARNRFRDATKRLFKQNIVSLENLDEAEKMLQQVRINPTILESDRVAFEKTLKVAKAFREKQKPTIEMLQQIGRTSFIDGERLQATSQEVHSFLSQLSGIPKEMQDILRPHITDLGHACAYSIDLVEALNKVADLHERFFSTGEINNQTFLNQWKSIRAQLNGIYTKASSLQPEYAQLPFLATNLLVTKEIPSMPVVGGYGQILQMDERFTQFESEIYDVPLLERKLSQDMGKSIKIKPGCYFSVQGKRYKIKSVQGNKIGIQDSKLGQIEFSSGMFYGALWTISNSNSSEKSSSAHDGEKKVEGDFFPALDTWPEVVQELKTQELLPMQEDINVDVKEFNLRTLKGDLPVKILDIDPKEKIVNVLHSKRPTKDEKGEEWTLVKMSYPEFIEFWKKKQLSIKPKTAISQARGVGTKDRTSKSGFRFASLGAFKQSVVWIRDTIKRKSEEREKVDASKMAKDMSAFLEYIPGLDGIYSMSQTANNETVLGIVEKWVKQYGEATSSGEFNKHFQQFNQKNKIQQAALLMIAAEKGLSKEEIYWTLGGDRTRRPDHNTYVTQVKGYFCKGADALPDKYETKLTKLISGSFDSEQKKGFFESRDMVTQDEIIRNIRYYCGEAGDGKGNVNLWKRIRGSSSIYALLKLGCNAEDLGKATLWHFKLIESAVNDNENNWSVDMMRKIGNMGKAFVPMLGLFRFPAGMAIARSMIDLISTTSLGSPFKAYSDCEEIMSMLFIGRFGAVEQRLRDSLTRDQFEQLRYLYFKARYFTHAMTEASPFSFKYPVEGSALDETTLGDAYGISGMMSSTWLETVLETRVDGQPDPHNSTNTDAWWKRLESNEEWASVTEDERILFSLCFVKALNAVQNPEEYFRRPERRKIIFKILKYLKIPPGQTIVYDDNRHPQETKECSSVEELETIVKDPKIRIKKININDAILEATHHSLSLMSQKILADGVDTNTRREVREREYAYMAESRSYKASLGAEVTDLRAQYKQRLAQTAAALKDE